MAAVARQGLVPLAVLLALALALLPGVRQAWRGLPAATTMRWGAPFLAWTLLANAWSSGGHWSAWVQSFAAAGIAVLAANGLAALRGAAARRAGVAALIGGLALALFLLEESFSGAAILSWVRPDDVQQSAATFFSLIMALVARGTAVLAPLSFALAGLAFAVTRSRLAAAALLLAVLLACVRLPMTASALALLAGLAVGGVVYLRPKPAVALLLAGLGAAILGAAPAARLVPDPAQAPAAQDQLELGVQHRLGIWHYVGTRIAERPVFGHGFNAARDLAATQPVLPGSGLPALPTHPHNAPLQIWLELGGIGALLAALALVGLWRAVQPVLTRPLHAALITAILTAAAVIASLSFSVWSTWWLAALGLVAGTTALAVQLLPGSVVEPQHDQQRA
jgi:O-antigen ligase